MPTAMLELDALPEAEAATALRGCCASTRWVQAMLAARPFGDAAGALAAAAAAWADCGPEDWREAMAAHPRIGERTADARAAGEQAATAQADTATLRALEHGNRRYEERFGHVFLIRARGRSADEMLAALHARLANDPETELRVAAGQQLEITKLRLRELVA